RLIVSAFRKAHQLSEAAQAAAVYAGALIRRASLKAGSVLLSGFSWRGYPAQVVECRRKSSGLCPGRLDSGRTGVPKVGPQNNEGVLSMSHITLAGSHKTAPQGKKVRDVSGNKVLTVSLQMPTAASAGAIEKLLADVKSGARAPLTAAELE